MKSEAAGGDDHLILRALPAALALAGASRRWRPHLADDLAGEAALATVEAAASGARPPDDAGFAAFLRPRVAAALQALIAADRRAGKVPGQPVHRHDRSTCMTPTAAVSDRPPPPRTPGQRRRARRNAVIAAAASAGCPQRLLAEVFNLPRSRIAEVVRAARPAPTDAGA